MALGLSKKLNWEFIKNQLKRGEAPEIKTKELHTENISIILKLILPKYDNLSDAPAEEGSTIWITGAGADPEGAYRYDGADWKGLGAGSLTDADLDSIVGFDLGAHGPRHKDGGADELDASELAGALGSANQILETDGSATSWVDKPAGFSMVSDLYGYGGLYWHTIFESLDGFSQSTTNSGSITLSYDEVQVSTGATVNSVAHILNALNYPLNTLTWDKNRRFKTVIYIDNAPTGANDVAWITFGYTGTTEHIGFKILAGELYGTVADGSTENTLDIQAIANGTSYVLEVVLTPGSEAEFFVDGASKGTLSSNIPTGTSGADMLFRCKLNNATTAADFDVRLSEVKLLQEE